MNYAGFWKRFLSYIIDVIPILLVVFVVWYLFFGFDQTWHDYLDMDNSIEERAGFLKERNKIRDTTFLLWILYGLFMDCSKYQGTFGKRVVGLKTVSLGGDRITFSQSLKRSTMKFVSALPLGLGFIWAAFRADKAAWHDLAAKTRVIKS